MEKNFVQGLRVFRPKEGAPEWLKLNLVLEKEALLMWLEAQEVDEAGRVRVDLKESKGGKLYCEVNTWKPTGEVKVVKEGVVYPEDVNPDDIPF